MFTRARLAVFVDGCFWHGCPDHGSSPTANGTWWAQKLANNMARDRDTDGRLLTIGWAVLRFWEHTDPLQAADVVVSAWERRVDVASSFGALRYPPQQGSGKT